MKMGTYPGWSKKTLRELATINYGKSPAAILSEDGAYPVVGTGGVERNGTDYLHDGESIVLGRKGSIERESTLRLANFGLSILHTISVISSKQFRLGCTIFFRLLICVNLMKLQVFQVFREMFSMV